MKKLLLAEAEFVAHKLAQELFDKYEEPMPNFNARYPGRLESCLEQPFQTFEGNDLYGSKISDKAAVLFYLIIKNHPFENGNKRMAVALALVFLFKNGFWLKILPDDLYRIALDVAQSKAYSKEVQLRALRETFSVFLAKTNFLDRL